MVLPWYEFLAAIISDLLVTLLASFKAPSVASVPELVM